MFKPGEGGTDQEGSADQPMLPPRPGEWIMTPLAFLHACAELEQSVGDLYRRFAHRLTAHPSTARLFIELADQEDTHARAMQLMSRLMLGAMGSTT